MMILYEDWQNPETEAPAVRNTLRLLVVTLFVMVATALNVAAQNTLGQPVAMHQTGANISSVAKSGASRRQLRL